MLKILKRVFFGMVLLIILIGCAPTNGDQPDIQETAVSAYTTIESAVQQKLYEICHPDMIGANACPSTNITSNPIEIAEHMVSSYTRQNMMGNDLQLRPEIVVAVNRIFAAGNLVRFIMGLNPDGTQTPAALEVNPTASAEEKSEAVQALMAEAETQGMDRILNIGPGEYYNATPGSMAFGVEKKKYTGIAIDELPEGVNPVAVNETRIQELDFGVQKFTDVIEVAPEPFLTDTTSSGNFSEHLRAVEGITENHFIAVGRNQSGFLDTFTKAIAQYETDHATDLLELTATEYQGLYGGLIQEGSVNNARIFTDESGTIIFAMGTLSELRSLSVNENVKLVQQAINSGFLQAKQESDPLTLIWYAKGARP